MGQIIIKDSSKFFQKALDLRRNGFAAIEYHLYILCSIPLGNIQTFYASGLNCRLHGIQRKQGNEGCPFNQTQSGIRTLQS